MSYLANSWPELVAPAQPDDWPEPAEIRLQFTPCEGGGWAYRLVEHATDTVLLDGWTDDREATRKGILESARWIGLVRVLCPWAGDLAFDRIAR